MTLVTFPRGVRNASVIFVVLLKHNPVRRHRTALFAAAATAATVLVATPTTASAEPRAAHDLTEQAARIGAPTVDPLTVDPLTVDQLTADQPTADELLAVCPIDGPATYEDSWGWARSGGRSHEGVDMIADRGAPIVAVVDGDALFERNGLGGNVVWLTAPDGDRFYYAHLDAFAGESRSVHAGDVIGFVGSTGNAGGAHLHFETHPGGRVENPYQHTLAACVPTPEELAAIEAHRANALNDPDLSELFIPTA